MTEQVRAVRVRDGVLSPERAPLTIGLIAIISGVAFESMAVATALPAIADDLGGLRLYGWSFSAFLLVSLVTAVAASAQADRRGPGAPLAAGMTLFAAGLVVAGFAPTMLVFILGRAIQGAGAGAVSTVAFVTISRGYPEHLRPRMLALLSTAWVAPALIGPGIAGFVSDTFTWRLVLLGLLPLVGLAAALTLPALRRLRVERSSDGRPGRLRAALLLAAGTAALLAGFSAPHPALGIALCAGGGAAAWQGLRRVLPAGTVTAQVGLPAGLTSRGLLAFCFFGIEAFLPLGLTSLRGLGTAQAGIVLSGSALSWTTGAWLQARLEARDRGAGRRRRTAMGFATVLAGGAISAAAVLSDSVPVALAIVGWTIGGLGMGLAYPSISLFVLDLAPPGEEGATSGSLLVSEQVCVAVGAGLGGGAINIAEALDWSPHIGIGAAFAIAAVGGLLGLAATRRLVRTASHTTQERNARVAAIGEPVA